MRSNLLDMQKSRLVAKRRKPAFWFGVMVANWTAVWLGGGGRASLWALWQGGLCRSIFYRLAPSFWRRCEPAFLGGYRALGGSDIASCAEFSMLGVVPRGLFACGLLVRFRIMQAPSYDRLISAIFLGRFTWVSLIIKAFF